MNVYRLTQKQVFLRLAVKQGWMCRENDKKGL